MEWPQGGPSSFLVPLGRDLGRNEAPMGSRERNQHLPTVTAPLQTSLSLPPPKLLPCCEPCSAIGTWLTKKKKREKKEKKKRKQRGFHSSMVSIDNIQLINSCSYLGDNWISYRSILFHGSHRGRIAASPRAIPLAAMVAAIVDQTESQKRSSRVTPIIARDNATYRSPFPHVTAFR